MKSERLMNEKRLALLKTIRKENPSLRHYMNDIINEMENPESAFNTGKMTKPNDLDRLTAMCLCDAFNIARDYAEKYHLDLTELIEFVSEETVLLVKENKVTVSGQFKKSIKDGIRKRYPFGNPLIARDELKNGKIYNRYDKICNSEQMGATDMDVSLLDSVLIEPMERLTDSEYSRDTVESITDYKWFVNSIDKSLAKLNSIEEKILRIRFGFEDGNSHTLEYTGNIFNLSGERIRQMEAKAMRKLHSRRNVSRLYELCKFLFIVEIYCTPVRRGPSIIISSNNNIFHTIHTFHIFGHWDYRNFCRVCGRRVRFRTEVKVGDRFRDIYYCRNCGRIYNAQKYSLQGTTQGRYLTGGVPPVRFSM